jgi:Chaperone of endosialidase
MSHALRYIMITFGAMIAIENRAVAQCFVCSDTNQNTAVGTSALLSNSGGTYNAAAGYQALYSNTSGAENSAIGRQALFSNTTGSRNNAAGEGALYTNTTANDNNAMGISALHNNSAGTLNNAMGNFALEFNTTGSNNNAVGYGSLVSNTTGSDNNGQGYFSLEKNTIGNLNIGVGYKAGSNLTTGSNNIDIGNSGLAAESGVIRIGTPGTQSAAFIAAVSGTNISGGSEVMISSSGQLGVVSSSRRYKEDIEPMGDISEQLYQLRPVTFRYKQSNADGQKPAQIGLIAEEVAGVLPELVVYNSDGQPESVAYHLLPTLLLSELQKEHRIVLAQEQQLQAVKAKLTEVDALRAEVAELKELTKQFAALRDPGSSNAETSMQVAMLK